MTIRTLPAVLAIATIAATGSFAASGANAAPAAKPPVAANVKTNVHYNNNWRGPVRLVCFRAWNGRWWTRQCVPQFRFNYGWGHQQSWNGKPSWNKKPWNNYGQNYPSRNYWR